MKKLFWTFILIAWGTIILTTLNYEMALHKASKVDTDGEIQEVMESYGFRGDVVFEEITEMQKFEAFFRTVFN
jgi:hypothetical protein